MCVPQLYGVPLEEAESDRALHNRRLDLAHSAATLLDKNSLLKYDRRTGNLQVKPASRFKLCQNIIADHMQSSLSCIWMIVCMYARLLLSRNEIVCCAPISHGQAS